MSDQKPPLAADTLDGVVGRAVDILDGNADRIDWRDPSQPELLRKLCEHLEAWDARGRELDMALDCIDACLADWPMLSHSRISAALSSWKTANTTEHRQGARQGGSNE